MADEPITQPRARVGPLSGVRIIDLTQVEAGPCATQLLADFGADVVKIERPGQGDLLRHADPYSTNGDDSAYFISLNRNKQSVTIDFKTDSGRRRIYQMLSDSDVLVENFRPGTLDKYGLGYIELNRMFPRLIYASATGFGSQGPLSSLGGQDLIAQAVSGMAMHNRSEDGRPRLDSIPVGDYATGTLLATGILLALLSRESTGMGQRVEVNLLDTLLAMQMQELTQWMMRGIETNFLKDFLAGAYECNDGWIVIAGYFVKRPLLTVCDAFGLSNARRALEADPATASESGRQLVEGELRAALLEYTQQGAMEILRAAGFLCAECLNYQDVVAHPQIESNRSLLDLQIEGRRVRTVDCPIKLSDTPATLRLPPPALDDSDPVSSGQKPGSQA